MHRWVSVLVITAASAMVVTQVVAAKPSGIPNGRPTWAAANRPVSPAPSRGSMKRAEAVDAVLSRMVTIFSQRLENYRTFLARVKSRIDKLKAQGKNVDTFTSYITTAQANIDAVNTSITHMQQTFNSMDKTGDMKTIRTTVRQELTGVRQSFTTLHKTMAQVVSMLLVTQTNGNGSAATPEARPTRVMPLRGNSMHQNQ